MKKGILFMLLAGSVSVFEACNSGNASKDAVDSVKNINNYNVSNKDTSKTTTSVGGATLLDYSGSGGIKMKKGQVTSRNTMSAPAPASEPTPMAAADTAKKDTTKK
jgi:hypothetical protein